MKYNRVETKHLTRREVKILALTAMANEWLPTAEAYSNEGFKKPDGTIIDYDEKTLSYFAEEFEKISDGLKERAEKLKSKKKGLSSKR